KMRLPFASLGLVPEFGSSYLLQARIGLQRAAELFFTSEWIDAARAVETGVALRALEDAQLLDAAMSKAREMAQWPVSGLRACKQLLRGVHQAGVASAVEAEERAMQNLAGSPENVEA